MNPRNRVIKIYELMIERIKNKELTQSELSYFRRNYGKLNNIAMKDKELIFFVIDQNQLFCELNAERALKHNIDSLLDKIRKNLKNFLNKNNLKCYCRMREFQSDNKIHHCVNCGRNMFLDDVELLVVMNESEREFVSLLKHQWQ